MNDNPIANIGELSKPATVLIEKISGAFAESGYANTDALKELDDAGIEAYVAVSRDENHTQRRYEYRPQKETRFVHRGRDM